MSRFFLLVLPLCSTACNDSASCIFTTGCNDDGGGSLSQTAAQLPIDGQWVVDGKPRVVSMFPSGNQNAGTTPVVLVFTESLIPDTVQGSIEIVPLVNGVPTIALRNVAEVLASDGRVLVLLPQVMPALTAGQYQVRVAEEAEISDLTGQVFEQAGGTQLFTFEVIATPVTVPRLVATFPADDALNQGETTEIVAIFDRPVRDSSVDTTSFDVKVAGVDPPNDPRPMSASGDTRVYLYRSIDGNGRAVPLGTDKEVTLSLSPAIHPITEQDNGILAPATISFRTSALAAPKGGSLLSNPHDAIGLANLTHGDPEELRVEVQVEGALANDSVDLFLFGNQVGDPGEDTPLIAIQGSPIQLSGPTPSGVFTLDDVDLLMSNDPKSTRLADGAVALVFRMRRGNVVTPVRVLDLDPDPEVIQDPILDTLAPTLRFLQGSGSTTATDVARSDQRGISIAGRASEKLRSVEVMTPLGNTGPAPVIGSDEDGFFLASPVPAVGQIASGTTTYTVVARDEALNPSAPVTGTFVQHGSVGPGVLLPGGSIEVEVFDARTLQPLSGANVYVHSDLGNGVDFPFVQVGQTLSNGRITLATGGPPSVGAIVTVERTGFDLFTLHGAPSSRLSVPLRESNKALARASGSLVSEDSAALGLVPGMDRRFDDSRRSFDLPRGFVGLGCSVGGGVLDCPYGPEAIRDSQLGARSFFAGDFDQTEGTYNAVQLLQAFTLLVPLPPAGVNALQDADLELPFVLFDGSTPASEVAMDLPVAVFRLDPGSGVDVADLADDVDTTGVPFVSVETRIPGLPGSIGVGQGLAFDQGSEQWNVRAAMPGAITAGGSLGSQMLVDSDPSVRMELMDQDGNAAGARPRLSAILAGGPAPEFHALPVPVQVSPPPAGSTGGQAFTVRITQAISDARSERGLYRVDLVDDQGRRWELWRLDQTGASDVELRVLDLGLQGGTGLSDGTLVSHASAFAWASFSPVAFLWSDVEREAELFSRSEPISFQKP